MQSSASTASCSVLRRFRTDRPSPREQRGRSALGFSTTARSDPTRQRRNAPRRRFCCYCIFIFFGGGFSAAADKSPPVALVAVQSRETVSHVHSYSPERPVPFFSFFFSFFSGFFFSFFLRENASRNSPTGLTGTAHGRSLSSGRSRQPIRRHVEWRASQHNVARITPKYVCTSQPVGASQTPAAFLTYLSTYQGMNTYNIYPAPEG